MDGRQPRCHKPLGISEREPIDEHLEIYDGTERVDDEYTTSLLATWILYSFATVEDVPSSYLG